MSVDPLADKYIFSTPYSYCNGNPVMLIDPDGRDVWELNDDGTIKARIEDKTQDAIALNGKSISFEYGTIDKAQGGEWKDGTKYDFFQFAEGKEAEAASAFKFMAYNSNVEYSLTNTQAGISGIYTEHTPNGVTSSRGVYITTKLANSVLTSHFHNHPNGTTRPSDADYNFANKNGNTHDYYIYPRNGKGVIQYYPGKGYDPHIQPWPYEAGKISSYMRQTGLPKLLRKWGLK